MVHLSETCAPGLPRLVTHVDTTPAGVYEATRVDAIHAALAAKGLLPSEHFADGAYLSAALLVRSRRDHGVRLRGPTKPTNGWQRHGGGLTVDAFRVDWRRREVTCPAGQTSSTWRTYDGAAVETGRGRDPYVKVRFAPSVCGSCALRARCVRTPGRRGRQLMLHPQAEQEALAAARAHHASRRGRRAYAIRSGIEGTVSQAVNALGLRRARYRGLAKTHVQAVATAAALNAARLSAWLAGRHSPRRARPTSPGSRPNAQHSPTASRASVRRRRPRLGNVRHSGALTHRGTRQVVRCVPSVPRPSARKRPASPCVPRDRRPGVRRPR
jgi:hypothetical protein